MQKKIPVKKKLGLKGIPNHTCIKQKQSTVYKRTTPFVKMPKSTNDNQYQNPSIFTLLLRPTSEFQCINHLSSGRETLLENTSIETTVYFVWEANTFQTYHKINRNAEFIQVCKIFNAFLKTSPILILQNSYPWFRTTLSTKQTFLIPNQ